MTLFLSTVLLIMGVLRLTMGDTGDFTEQEIFQALTWIGQTNARQAARALSGAMDKELGVAADSPGATTFSEDFLLVLSLLSEDARVRAEKQLRERPTLTEAELAAWHRKRSQVREAFVKQGKLKE